MGFSLTLWFLGSVHYLFGCCFISGSDLSWLTPPCHLNVLSLAYVVSAQLLGYRALITAAQHCLTAPAVISSLGAGSWPSVQGPDYGS